MYELREFEAALVDRVVLLAQDKGSFLDGGTKLRSELMGEVLDFLVEGTPGFQMRRRISTCMKSATKFVKINYPNIHIKIRS